MINAVQARWDREAPGDKTWCPSYPPRSETDEQKFVRIMYTIGEGIGNAAAHEIGHHFVKFPYIDCGPAGVGTNPPWSVCQGGDNFVYNWYLETFQPNSQGGGLFFFGLDTVPIHWQQMNSCYLEYWTKYIPSNTDTWYQALWKFLTSHNGCQSGG